MASLFFPPPPSLSIFLPLIVVLGVFSIIILVVLESRVPECVSHSPMCTKSCLLVMSTMSCSFDVAFKGI
jgi:hypothetical protein